MFGANGTAGNAMYEAFFTEPDDDMELRRMLYTEDDEDDVMFIDDDEEFLRNIPGVLGTLAGIPGAVVNTVAQQGAQAINNLIQPPKRPAVNVKAPSNWGARVTGSTGATVVTPGGPVPVKFQQAFVSKSQLDAALEGVRRDIGAVRTALQQSDARHNKALDNVSRTTATAIAADTAKTRQDLAALERRVNRRMDDQRQLTMMMSLMGDELGGDDMMLPMMLMMNSGGSDSAGGGMDMNTMMMVVMAMRS